MVTCSRSPSQNGSIISNGSGKPSSSPSSLQKVMAPQKVAKDEGRKRNGEKCFLAKAACGCLLHAEAPAVLKPPSYTFSRTQAFSVCNWCAGLFFFFPLYCYNLPSASHGTVWWLLCVGLCKSPFFFFLFSLNASKLLKMWCCLVGGQVLQLFSFSVEP